jgi:hypothetical protein
VTQQNNREANHDTDEADKRSRQFGSLFPPEEFEYGVPRGNQERFRDRAEQALKHSHWSHLPPPGFNCHNHPDWQVRKTAHDSPNYGDSARNLPLAHCN